MAPLEHEDPQVCKDHQALKDFKDPKEKPVIRVQLDHQDLWDREVFPDCLAKMANPAKMENPVRMGLQDDQESVDYRACLVYQGQRVIVAFQDWMVPRVELVLMARKENRVASAHLDLPVRWVLLAQEVNEDVKVHLARLVSEALMA